ncbi:4-carboxymuconolactone decarboxylase [Sphingobium lactosutens]|uniref:carboxymuconolactone decarboxylase family protein n=1 Tax=Sphingobium lactosutens TaxID=522773 RepID=UPI0015BE4F10|nr:carboxymuconolactone decarboxylase family protein [Sphingobium lactosutens]NWK97492.1 4-carboxymuconolactone decarboxylase [Sphingobium lactosutens]
MESEKFEAGLAVRKAVLGSDYVERSLASADEFSMPFQKLVTEYCWGEVWTRDGLDRPSRSIINIAMLVALNRNAELRLHIGGALTNGVTPEQIREVLLQTTIYCGVPAALEGFRIAREVFAERASQG